MPIAQAKCTNCGGNLEVDSSLEAAVCPFCKTPYIVEKAINNYNTYVTNNIKADTVVINNAIEKEFETDRATLVKYIGRKKDVTIPDGITCIGKEAFKDCDYITSITIPDSVVDIKIDAFNGCSGLTGITIPKNVKSISDQVFDYCNLESITVAEGNPYYCSSGNCLIKTEAYTRKMPDGNVITGTHGIIVAGCRNSVIPTDGSVVGIAYGAFRNRMGLDSIVIPESVVEIGNWAFIDCHDLKSVTMLGSVERIGNRAFAGCNKLTNIRLNEGLVSIGKEAFWRCRSLKSITIPNSVKSIGDYAFRECTNLADIDAPENAEYGSQVFCDSDNVPAKYRKGKYNSSKTKLDMQEVLKTPVGGCYVATCVYGSYDCPQVWTLRRYRDDKLASTWYGRAFIRTYYAVSPMLVRWFGKTKWFKNMWRGKLNSMVMRLNSNGVLDTPYKDKKW